MGRFSDLLNEEFILGSDNVRLVEEDPSCLPEILERQRARGLGPARALRAHQRRERAAEREDGGPGVLGWLGAASVGLLAGFLLARDRDA